jgi:hypothetical protein
MKPSFSRAGASFVVLASLLLGCGGVSPPGADDREEQSLGLSRFEKLWTCDGAVVDVDAANRRDLQLVVTDPDALRVLSGERLIWLPFGATEYVVRGNTRSFMDFGGSTGPKLRRGNGREVFTPADFDYLLHDETSVLNRTLIGRVDTVFRRGSDVILQFATIHARGCAGTIVTSTDCGGEGGGSCPHSFCDGDDFTSFDLAREYVFHGCS